MSTTACHLVVAGRVDDARFQAARCLGEDLAREQANVFCEVKPMFATDWQEFLAAKAADLDVTHESSSPMVFYNKHHYIGGLRELSAWAVRVYDFESSIDPAIHEEDGRKRLHAMMEATGHTFCYLDVIASADRYADPSELVHHEDECKECKEEKLEQKAPDATTKGVLERVVIELYDDVCPNTCDNFVLLCEGDGEHGCYKGSAFHRIVQNGWAQGGDVVDGSGKHSVAAIGKSGKFADENFALKHDRAGMVSMAGEGKPHTNGSQFFVTLAPLPWLNCKRVAFGRVVYGLDVFTAMQALPRKNERPIGRCEILDCGVFSSKHELRVTHGQ